LTVSTRSRCAADASMLHARVRGVARAVGDQATRM